MNKVMLCGNVGRVDVHVGEYGKLVRMSVATNERWKSKDGEKKEHTEWHNVLFSGKLSDVAEMYVEKGDKVLVGGKIKTGKPYKNKDGLEQSSKDIVADFLELIGSRTDKKPSDDAKDYAKASGGQVSTAPANNFVEDDIPF